MVVLGELAKIRYVQSRENEWPYDHALINLTIFSCLARVLHCSFCKEHARREGNIHALRLQTAEEVRNPIDSDNIQAYAFLNLQIHYETLTSHL